jgi:N-acetylmuramoyl-L-alanine amidase
MYLYLITNNKENGINPINDEYARNFVIATIEESEAEGVRPDVVFSLMMHETGFLNFGGDVDPSQNNFGGLGTTGGGVKGASFEDMRTGIRAVVQHLKCYASEEPLQLELVDPRWSDKLRARAAFVEYLGYADNPNGTGWAMPGNGYGQALLKRIDTMANLDTKDVASIMATSASSENAVNSPKKEGEISSKFPQKLLVLNYSNVINFTIAFTLFISIVMAMRFKSRYNF